LWDLLDAKSHCDEEDEPRRRSERDVGEDAHGPLDLPVPRSSAGATAAFAAGADVRNYDKHHPPKVRRRRRSGQRAQRRQTERASSRDVIRPTSRLHEEGEVEDARRHAQDEVDDPRHPPVGRGDGGVAQAAVDERDGGEEQPRRAQRHQEPERAVVGRRGLRPWRGTRTRLGVEEAEDLEGDEPGAQVDEARGGSGVHHGGR
jgi:hypothetical protein